VSGARRRGPGQRTLGHADPKGPNKTRTTTLHNIISHGSISEKAPERSEFAAQRSIAVPT
jgi:hypothetical protein